MDKIPLFKGKTQKLIEEEKMRDLVRAQQELQKKIKELGDYL